MFEPVSSTHPPYPKSFTKEYIARVLIVAPKYTPAQVNAIDGKDTAEGLRRHLNFQGALDDHDPMPKDMDNWDICTETLSIRIRTVNRPGQFLYNLGDDGTIDWLRDGAWALQVGVGERIIAALHKLSGDVVNMPDYLMVDNTWQALYFENEFRACGAEGPGRALRWIDRASALAAE